jgi:hypothetical protein
MATTRQLQVVLDPMDLARQIAELERRVGDLEQHVGELERRRPVKSALRAADK